MAKDPKKIKVSPEEHERLKQIGTQKGEPSRNPAGRPKEDEAMRNYIRGNLPRYFARLEEIGFNGKNEASMVKALDLVVSYAMSKASTKVEHEVTHSFGEFLSRVAKRRPEIIEASFEEIPAITHETDDSK